MVKTIRPGGMRSLAAAVLALALGACGGARPAPPPLPTPMATPVLVAPAAPADPLPVVFPNDDAPHPRYNTEWWYYNGHVQTDTGEEYSFHYVVFDVRYPGIQPINIYQVAVTDHRKGSYSQGQRSISSPPAQRTGGAFSYTDGDWMVSGGAGADHIASSSGGYAFDLELRSDKPPVLHGGTGYLAFTPTSKTYYYSRPRMEVSGTMAISGVRAKVTGMAWFDHQWGNFRPEQGGWDWFAVQFNDGRDLMVTQLRDAAGAIFYAYGTLVAKDGSIQALPGESIRISSTGTWTSPDSGGVYPLNWRLQVPEAGLDVTLSALVQSSEFDATKTTLNRYWEGAVGVAGNGGGKGYLEMVGYAPVRTPGR